MSANFEYFKENVPKFTSIEELMGNAVGFWSMCWEGQNRDAVFDSASAVAGLRIVMSEIERHARSRLLAHLSRRLDVSEQQGWAVDVVESFKLFGE